LDDLNGICTYYRTDGTKEKVLNYVLGKQHGKSTYYNSKGEAILERIYYDDALIEENKL